MATVELNSNANLQITGTNHVKIGPHEAVPVPPSFTGSLYAWGDNSYGKLGYDGTTTASPVHVATNASDWARLSFSANAQHFGAIKTNGTLHMWGRNNYGQLGFDNQEHASSPVQLGTDTNWDKIATNYNKTVASKTDGSLWAWGLNYPYGELGNNNIFHVSSPVMIMPSGNTWTSVSLGYDFCQAVRSDGKLYCWGRNSYGQLGINNTADKSSPVQVGTDTTWSKVATGSFHTLAIKTNGTLWAWGKNNNGNLGILNNIAKSSPVQIGSLSDWTFVAASTNTSFAIRDNGKLYGWGNGDNGNVEYGYSANKSSPHQLLTDRTWTSVCSSVGTTAAITSGQIWTWGNNHSFGTCGQNNFGGSESPAPIFNGDSDWSELSGGYLCFIARK